MNRRPFRIVLFVLIALSLFFIAIAIYAGGGPEDSGSGIHVDRAGIAARGADVVAYFSLKADSEAVLGIKEHAYQWNGASWLFSSIENRETFAAEPERYAPQYGGYCAWAMARDKLATIDPDMWTIVDGKLYLNYSAKTQKNWAENMDKQIVAADEFWPERNKKLASD